MKFSKIGLTLTILGLLTVSTAQAAWTDFLTQATETAKAVPAALEIAQAGVAAAPQALNVAQELNTLIPKLQAHVNVINAAKTQQEKYAAAMKAINDVVIPTLKSLDTIAITLAPIIQKAGEKIVPLVNKNAGDKLMEVGAMLQRLRTIRDGLDTIHGVVAQQIKQMP